MKSSSLKTWVERSSKAGDDVGEKGDQQLKDSQFLVFFSILMNGECT